MKYQQWTTQIAVAMGSALDFHLGQLQEAFEGRFGGGFLEIYAEIAEYAEKLGGILNDAGCIMFGGVFEYEVAEPFVKLWQAAIIDGTYDAAHLDLELGRLTFEFLNGDGDITEKARAAITAHTGFKIWRDPEPEQEKAAGEVLVLLDATFALPKGSEDEVYDCANMMLIPLQRHEGGGNLIDYTFLSNPVVSPTPVSEALDGFIDPTIN